jgi:hypothetical protein
MIHIHDDATGYLTVEVIGKLSESDYHELVPRLARERQRGKLRLLMLLQRFEGFTPRGLLEELRFDVGHRADFERIAVVGAGALEKVAMKLAAPFFSGSQRHFEREADARAWLAEPRAEATPAP